MKSTRVILVRNMNYLFCFLCAAECAIGSISWTPRLNTFMFLWTKYIMMLYDFATDKCFWLHRMHSVYKIRSVTLAFLREFSHLFMCQILNIVAKPLQVRDLLSSPGMQAMK